MIRPWNNLNEFASWYVKSGYPIRPPFEDPVYITSISYSYVLFRDQEYQAELYLVKPNASSPEHSHPGVENIIIVLGGEVSTTHNGVLQDYSEAYNEPSVNGTNKLLGLIGPKLTDKDTHSLIAGNKGGAFLSIEKWPKGQKPTSVTINWKGDPVDSEHQSIIEVLEQK